MTHWPLFSILYKIIDISAFEKMAFLSILIASSYGGGDSSTQYLGGESIPSFRTRNSFFLLALQIQKFMI